MQPPRISEVADAIDKAFAAPDPQGSTVVDGLFAIAKSMQNLADVLDNCTTDGMIRVTLYGPLGVELKDVEGALSGLNSIGDVAAEIRTLAFEVKEK